MAGIEAARIGLSGNSDPRKLILGFTPRQVQMVVSLADTVGYGGAAGGGKTRGSLNLGYNMCLKYPGYQVLAIRKTLAEAKKQGSLWPEAMSISIELGEEYCEINKSELRVDLWNGSSLQVGYLKDENSHKTYDGSQFQMLIADEATQIRGYQLLYLRSRLRSPHKDWPRRAIFLSNPDRLSPLYNWFAPWVSTKHEWYPYKPGALLYMEVIDEMESTVKHYKEPGPNRRSITFIPALLKDNPFLADTGYDEEIQALSRVERARLGSGDWEASYIKGGFFEIEKIVFKDFMPTDVDWIGEVRSWDTAASENRDGDFTVGLRALSDGYDLLVRDVFREKLTPPELKGTIIKTARRDGKSVRVVIEREGGGMSAAFIDDVRKELKGHIVESVKPHNDKKTRALNAAEMMREGRIHVLRRPWTNEFVSEHEAFPKAKPQGKYDDQVDALTQAELSMFGSGMITAAEWPSIGISI